MRWLLSSHMIAHLIVALRQENTTVIMQGAVAKRKLRYQKTKNSLQR